MPLTPPLLLPSPLFLPHCVSDAEDLHHFDTASWRLMTAATGDQGLRRSVLFILTYRPNFGALSPTLRQRPGGRELRYQRVQAAYRTLLAQVSGTAVRYVCTFAVWQRARGC